MQVNSITPNSVDFLQIAVNAHDFDNFEAATGIGNFTTSQIDYAGCHSGSVTKPAHFRLSPRDAVLTVSRKEPMYWVLPLSNFTSRFVGISGDTHDHPLRISTQQQIISFTWKGRPAFIEPMLDYKSREQLLMNGDARNLLTAVMVGELDQRSLDISTIDRWLPSTLLRTLGFATGNQIGAPWVELRAADGELVSRIHRSMGVPTFSNGHRIIEETSAENTAHLLEAIQNPPFSDDPHNVYRVLMHHAERAGAEGATIDDRLSHLYRAFDRHCTEYGISRVVLRDVLAQNTKTSVVEILDRARREIKQLSKQYSTPPGLIEAKALVRIADRVGGADQVDRDFGTCVCELAHRFNMNDEAVMDAHLKARFWRTRVENGF